MIPSTLRVFLRILAVLSLAVASMGCQGDPAATVGPEAADGLDSGEYAVLDFEDAMDAVLDATPTRPMSMDPALCSGEALEPRQPFGPGAPPGPQGPRKKRVVSGNHLGAILRAMGLMPEQREQVRGLMAAHRECVTEPLAEICQNSQDLIEAANEQRRAIVDAARSGEISREEAGARIRELNQATREAIAQDPDNQEALERLCDCKLDLFDGIRSILDTDQQAVWDAWIDLLEDPCLEAGE